MQYSAVQWSIVQYSIALQYSNTQCTTVSQWSRAPASPPPTTHSLTGATASSWTRVDSNLPFLTACVLHRAVPVPHTDTLDTAAGSMLSHSRTHSRTHSRSHALAHSNLIVALSHFNFMYYTLTQSLTTHSSSHSLTHSLIHHFHLSSFITHFSLLTSNKKNKEKGERKV
jgi:hypothetical protein